MSGHAARVPLLEMPLDIASRLADLGGRPVNLYRALANNPEILAAFIEFAWAVRRKARTSRRLRELMIVLGALIMNSPVELAYHRQAAIEQGVTEEELAELSGWRSSRSFSKPERAALALMEAMIVGSVPDSVNNELAKNFDAPDRIELTITAGLYCMVPRVLDALRIPPETGAEDTAGDVSRS